MRDIRGCIGSIKKLHDFRMELYKNPRLTDEDVVKLNTIDAYLNGLRNLLETLDAEYESEIRSKRLRREELEQSLADHQGLSIPTYEGAHA